MPTILFAVFLASAIVMLLVAGGGFGSGRLAAGLILCGTLVSFAAIRALEPESSFLQRKGRLVGAALGALGGGSIAVLYYPTWPWVVGMLVLGALLGSTYREWLRFM
jgi:hypothetical protein